MFLLGDDRRLVISAGDLRTASACEFAVVAELDAVRGLRDRAEAPDDPMLARVAALGDQHEQAELRRLSREHPGRVVQLERPEYTPEGLAAAMAGTLEALRGGAEVAVQATVFDGGLVGHADVLELTPHGWLVSDTKLARSESVAALLQVAGYAALLRGHGVEVAPTARLVLGGGTVHDVPLGEIVPVYRARRARLDSLLAEHRAEGGRAEWGDERWLACGRCPTCEAEVEASRDLLLVAGMRGTTRRRLRDAGVRTVEDLALRSQPVPDVRTATLQRLRAQARLQLEQDADPDGRVRHEVVDARALHRMPTPSDGDVFFDFEGDPLWQERGSDTWGLEYLFGMVEVDSGAPVFRAFWAHDRAEERLALVSFVDHVTERRRRWPDLHVYHYAPYEPSALLRLAARHGVYEDEVDQLLRDGVFVDLYAVVRAAVRVSQRSYSIKRLEPLYMPRREGEVQGGAESIVVYHQHLAARIEGRAAEARGFLDEIARYNEDDCVSTYLLREWLLARRAEADPAGATSVVGAAVAAEVEVGPARRAALDLEAALRALVDAVPTAERTPADRAVALVASAVLFHAREDKPMWQGHFERLRLPVGDWRPADGVVVLDRAEVVRDWYRPPRARKARRRLRLVGEPMRTPVTVGARVAAVYAVPAPDGVEAGPLHANAASPAGVRVLEAEEHVEANGRTHQVLVVEELQPGATGHADLPTALVPGDPVGTAPLDRAIAEVAELVRATGDLPEGAAVDVLLRRAPRMRDGGALPPVGSGPDRHVDAVTEALVGMDDSYVAVQGPPGTGKTYVGAHVVARLVEQGWRVGVCSQGHAAVENLLTAVVRAGVHPSRVGKAARATADPTWTALAAADDLARFAAGHEAAGRGYVVGGSAWDLTTERRVARGRLDLLVLDEAGQFSLAKTLAVSVAARRLLLLGDPQQLPQVTTGTHAEPVDRSALGWLTADAAVLPDDVGYFLETTWRMHPALTIAVSDLAYDGRLRSERAVTAARTLEGVSPGLHVRLVDHHDNSTRSPEEADAVLGLVTDLLGRTWHDPAVADARPLGQGDVVVITPYNSQVVALRRVLDDAGLDAVRVGTVDTFQGQEAPVAILSMAGSSHTDVSRGMAFLLDRRRLNVAVSRGQHCAFVVRSRRLTDFPPRSAAELRALGAFLRLCDRAVSTLAVDTPLPLPA